jgi:predicted dehydrogenase
MKARNIHGSETNKTTLSRRQFVGVLGAATGAVLTGCTSPSSVRRSVAPSGQLNIACIGPGGMGGFDLKAIAAIPGINVVALCDVDDRQDRAGVIKAHPEAKRFKDFRRMLDAMGKDIDGVVVGTPDHTHAVAAMAVMERGLHLYCEKPLAHSVWEVRRLMAAAAKYKVVTQLGNQGHSYDSCRQFCEWIWDGAIGNVHTIHCGANQVSSGLDSLAAVRAECPPVPPELDWNLWQGPAAERPYHPAFLPGSWRSWTAYGNGTIGDWLCHVVDPVFWALDLGAPATICAEVKNYDFKTQGETFPKGDIVTFEFPARGKRGPVTLHWHSGTEPIPRPPELEADEETIKTGAVVIGDKGTIVYGSHGATHPHLVPAQRMRDYKKPAPSILRTKGHHQDWVAAIRENRKAGSDFGYGGPLTEIALLGIIAIKMAPIKLVWDSKAMSFANCNEANHFLNSHTVPAGTSKSCHPGLAPPLLKTLSET